MSWTIVVRPPARQHLPPVEVGCYRTRWFAVRAWRRLQRMAVRRWEAGSVAYIPTFTVEECGFVDRHPRG